ncbi:MAG: flagellar biosynthesis anti-sigma factor FlgM [Butyrivibrio sp.]|jgi:negative regulator of flagellin synthesis FlgM|nr:flagellar biosynthesis anti-sigma factor FlgM [Butyrivibrio sp.]
MRIEAYNQIQQIYNSSKVQKAAKTEKTSRMDAVQISSIGKDIQAAKQALNETSDIREDVVSPLRQSVQNGTYDVDDDSFADKLLDGYSV